MTFLSPTVLFGLAAVSIPLIIHLFSKFRTQNVEFSTIRFIQDLEHETIRNIKIKQWIILLLRMIIILALVILFSRPVMEGFIPGWMGAELESRIVIVLDNSASMSAKIDGESRLSRSKNSIVDMVSVFGDNTLLDVYQTNPPKLLYSRSIDLPVLKPIIQAISPTSSNDNLWTFVDSALSIIESTEPNKECIIFSDFQTWPDSVQSVKDYEHNWRYYLVSQGHIQDNLSILDVQSVSRVKTKNQLLKLNTRILNNGSIPKANIPIELFFDEHRVGQVVTEFSPGISKDFLFQAFPTGERLVQSKIQLPSDDFILDNELVINLPITHEIKCALFSRSTDNIFMLETALNSINEKEEFLTIERQIQPELNRLFLDDIDVAIFHNVGQMSDQSITDLKKFQEQGGGIIWFSGRLENQPSRLEEIGIPIPQRLIESNSGFFKAEKGEYFKQLFHDLNVRHVDREMPEIFTYVKVAPSRSNQVLIKLNNGDPFLMESIGGSGHMFYFSSLIDLRWNDLPMRGSFIPMIHKLLVTAGTDDYNSDPVQIDESKWVALTHELLNHEWELIRPSGSKEKLIPDFKKKGLMIKNTSELGSYTIYSNGSPFTSFSTSLHPDEIPTDPFKKAELLSIFPENNAKYLENSTDFTQVFNEARHGRSLWKSFLLIALLSMIAETILSRGTGETIKRDEN